MNIFVFLVLFTWLVLEVNIESSQLLFFAVCICLHLEIIILSVWKKNIQNGLSMFAYENEKIVISTVYSFTNVQRDEKKRNFYYS